MVLVDPGGDLIPKHFERRRLRRHAHDRLRRHDAQSPQLAELPFRGWWTGGAQPHVARRSQVLLDRLTRQPRRPSDRPLAFVDLPATNHFFNLHPMQLPIPHPVHPVLWWSTWWRMGPLGGLKLDGDLLA